MPQPATHRLTIHPGAVFSRTLTAAAAGEAFDLSAYTPFRMEIRDGPRPAGTLLATVTVDNDDLATGIIRLAMTAEETDVLEDGDAFYDIIDGNGDPWIIGPAKIRRTISDPSA